MKSNKTMYFRLRLNDEVRELKELAETDLYMLGLHG